MSAAHDERTTAAPPQGVVAAERDPATCVLSGELDVGATFYEVVSFLGRAKWRGELIVQVDDVRRALFFDEGHVVFAQSTSDDERIGAVLARTGVLSDEQVAACVEKQGDGSLRFGEAAVELGFLTHEALFRAMDRQLEAVFDAVVSETHGSFHFFLGFDDAELSFRQRHRVDALLAKSISRIEQEEYFHARIPSWEHVPVRVEGIDPPEEDRLGIFGAIDGRRTASQIRDLCAGSDDLEVMRGLFELVQSGHVTVEPPRIGVNRVVGIYNEAIEVLVRELDAMDEGDAVRAELEAFAKNAPRELFGGAGPAENGTFDGAKIEANVLTIGDAEERVARWLYDYASYALFLARPRLERRDGPRVSMRVNALLAPIAPRRDVVAVGSDVEISESSAPPRSKKTVPVLANSPPPKAPEDEDAKGKTARLVAFPGIDPSRTLRMAKATLPVPKAGHYHARARIPSRAPAAAAPAPAPAAPPPAVAAPKSGMSSSSVALLVALAAVVTAFAVMLIMRHRETSPQATELVVACEPECTAVYVDGDRLPAAHGTFPVPAGAHEIVASRPGFRTELKKVSVREGNSRAVAFTLEPE